MLYYRALVAGLDALPQADARSARRRSTPRPRERGWPALHAELAKVDPAAARRIKPNDAQRIQRALEVWRLTGKPLRRLQALARPALPFEVKAFALVRRARGAASSASRSASTRMLRLGLVDGGAGA